PAASLAFHPPATPYPRTSPYLTTFDRSSLTFFLLTRPPPRPPLFPYTTLFRSPAPDRRSHRGSLQDGCVPFPLQFVHREPQLRRDRKSTRLNSSHVAISYAVFFLKKKMCCLRSRTKCVRSAYRGSVCGGLPDLS